MKVTTHHDDDDDDDDGDDDNDDDFDDETESNDKHLRRKLKIQFQLLQPQNISVLIIQQNKTCCVKLVN